MKGKAGQKILLYTDGQKDNQPNGYTNRENRPIGDRHDLNLRDCSQSYMYE